MPNPFRRDKIENWVSDFLTSDRFLATPSLVQEYGQTVLSCFLTRACSARDVEPEDLTEEDCGRALLEGVARLEIPQSVKSRIPDLCGGFLEALESQGRLGGGSECARRVRVLRERFCEQSGAKPIRRPGSKLGRNDPCPCGSGKKYKKCCMNLLRD